VSKSDCIAAKAPGYIGMPYKLGEEGPYVAGPEQTTAADVDCSGLFYALLLDCGVTLNGKRPDRLTADDYWRMATPIAAPSVPGDCCWFPATGRKTHMAIYIGGGKTIEAGNHGPNNAYPGAGYVGTCTTRQMNERGAVWGRIEGLDIYAEEEGMTDDDRRLLQEAVVLGRQNRVSNLARSYDMEVLKAMIAGEPESVIDALEAQKAKELRAMRKALGLGED
jgi:hypothetical protein